MNKTQLARALYARTDLSRAQAIGRLRAEMAKVWELHQRLERAERKLKASHQREEDLMALLQRWRQRAQE